MVLLQLCILQWPYEPDPLFVDPAFLWSKMQNVLDVSVAAATDGIGSEKLKRARTMPTKGALTGTAEVRGAGGRGHSD